MYDIIIVGGGPAGLNAGLYAGRDGLNVLLLEKSFPGGQIINTIEVDNYIALNNQISGAELAAQMAAHAQRFGMEIKTAEVTALETEGAIKRVITPAAVYEAKAVILAMGAKPRKLGVPGEERLSGKGVSYCAACDGAFFKKKTVAVVGGGDTAAEDALFLSRYCEKVYLIHRRDSLRAVKSLQTALLSNEKVEFIWNSEITEIRGGEVVETLLLHNNVTQTNTELPLSALFVAVGLHPATHFLPSSVKLDGNGYIITDPEMKTNIPGVFAAGDACVKSLRQVITAAADGAIAAHSASRYIGTELCG